MSTNHFTEELTQIEWRQKFKDIVAANLMLGYTLEVASRLALNEMNSKYTMEPYYAGG